MDSVIAERVAAVQVKADEAIERCGHSIMYIFPTEGDSLITAFAYTVGLTEAGWPELVVQGLPAEYTEIILNDLVGRCRKREKPPERGEIFHEICNCPVTLGTVDEEYIEENLGMSARRAASKGLFELRALQLIFPDKTGKFPREAGYDLAHMGRIQQCLAPGSKWDY